MAVRLEITASDFATNFRALLETKREASADVEATVRVIVDDVAARGDAAVKEYTRKFDHCDLDRAGLQVTRQAIAAVAYGTQSIAAVAKIVGPGNAYVAAAKRIVFGKVGIDMIAGPSEVLILADKTGHADWIAADLLAQAEHDESAQPILITDDAALADAVETAVSAQLPSLPRAAVAGASWRDFGAIILLGALADAVHLAGRIRNAGAIFLGAHTPEAIGDYVGGSNHVLPTARSARFSSGLGVLDFMKRTSVLKCGPDQLRALGPAARTTRRIASSALRSTRNR